MAANVDTPPSGPHTTLRRELLLRAQKAAHKEVHAQYLQHASPVIAAGSPLPAARANSTWKLLTPLESRSLDAWTGTRERGSSCCC